jgi:serine O-acetyltransferase
MYKFGYEIPVSARIGKGFYIGHLGGIVINPKASIGNNVNIARGVTIGQTNRGDKEGTPTIGDLVWIGTNAVIVGKITIGSNVLIAPNAYVNFDVPDNSIVIGNPAKIVPKENATKGYINNIVE